jgi:hypothetical protein
MLARKEGIGQCLPCDEGSIPISTVVSAVAGMCTAPAPRQDRQELPSSPILRRGKGAVNFYIKIVVVSIRGTLLVHYISEYCKAAASGSSFEQFLDKKFISSSIKLMFPP